MSERGGRGGGTSRGGSRGGPGAVRGAHPKSRGDGSGSGGSSGQQDRKKEVILDLAKFVDKRVRVKLQGGREVQGILKGYDQLMNLVMDEVREHLPTDVEAAEQKTRLLGLVVLRGTAVTIINPAEGFEQIANPFASGE